MLNKIIITLTVNSSIGIFSNNSIVIFTTLQYRTHSLESCLFKYKRMATNESIIGHPYTLHTCPF